jgi:hypothetical protein
VTADYIIDGIEYDRAAFGTNARRDIFEFKEDHDEGTCAICQNPKGWAAKRYSMDTSQPYPFDFT